MVLTDSSSSYLSEIDMNAVPRPICPTCWSPILRFFIRDSLHGTAGDAGHDATLGDDEDDHEREAHDHDVREDQVPVVLIQRTTGHSKEIERQSRDLPAAEHEECVEH